MQQNKTYHLSDVEDFPSLCVKGHQPGGDEVSSPRFHSAVQHLIEIHLDKQANYFIYILQRFNNVFCFLSGDVCIFF